MGEHHCSEKKDFPATFFMAIFGHYIRKHRYEIEVRCIPHESDIPVIRRFYSNLTRFERGWKEIVGANRKRYEIYFGVALRDRETHKPLLLTCIWADIDFGSNGASNDFEEALRRVRKLKMKPTVIVKSGHGLHIYYRLTKPIGIDGAGTKRLLRGLAQAVHGDLQAAEPARLLRVPNTLNWKGE